VLVTVVKTPSVAGTVIVTDVVETPADLLPPSTDELPTQVGAGVETMILTTVVTLESDAVTTVESVTVVNIQSVARTVVVTVATLVHDGAGVETMIL
jgi:hypothetical protein